MSAAVRKRSLETAVPSRGEPSNAVKGFIGGAGRNGGFTMLEALVVAIIVAVLASIAIPSYRGYIRSTRKSGARDLARTAAMAADAYYRKKGAEPTVDKLNLSYDPTMMEVTIDTVARRIMVIVVDESDLGDTLQYR